MKWLAMALVACSLLLWGCRQKSNYILIVDTSKSMVSDNLINQVKESVRQIALDAQAGDRIILKTFDSDVQTVGEFEISGAQDLKPLFSQIQDIKAKGLWTDLVRAMDDSLGQVVNLQKTQPHRKNVIVFYTDGRHDPSPEQQKQNVNFKNLISKYYNNYDADKSWFIYYVELGEVDPNLENFLAETNSGVTVSGQAFAENQNFLVRDNRTRRILWLVIAVLGFIVIAYYTRPWWRRVRIRLEARGSSQVIDFAQMRGRLSKGRVKIGNPANPAGVVGLDWKGDLYVKPAKLGSLSLDGQTVLGASTVRAGQTLKFEGTEFEVIDPKDAA